MTKQAIEKIKESAAQLERSIQDQNASPIYLEAELLFYRDQCLDIVEELERSQKRYLRFLSRMRVCFSSMVTYSKWMDSTLKTGCGFVKGAEKKEGVE